MAVVEGFYEGRLQVKHRGDVEMRNVVLWTTATGSIHAREQGDWVPDGENWVISISITQFMRALPKYEETGERWGARQKQV